MKTITTTFLLLFFFVLQLKAQQLTFSKTYGDSSNASVYSIRENENNGFLLFGSRSNPVTSSSELTLIKTSNSGTEEKSKYFGSPDFKYLVLLEQDKDKNFISAQIQDTSTWGSILVKKLSPDYQVLSSKVLPIFTDSFWNGYFSNIHYLPGQGFLVYGQSKGNQSNYYLYLMDEDGNVKWHLAPSQSNIRIQFISSVKQFGNNIILMGSALSQNKYGTFISIIDQSGFEVKTKHFTSFSGNEFVGSGIVLQSDGNFLFTGHKNKPFGISDIMLAKLNPDLDTIWTKYYSSEKVDPDLKDGSQFGAGATAATQDGGAVIVLNDVNRFGTMHDYLARFDKSGNLLWTKHLDSSYTTSYYTIIETLDGGIGLAGTKNGYFHFLKLNAEGTLSGINKQENSENKIKIYPNPAENEIYIDLNNNSFNTSELNIFDISGKKVKSLYNLSSKTIVIQRDDLKAGVYFLRMQDQKGNIFQEKLILK